MNGLVSSSLRPFGWLLAAGLLPATVQAYNSEEHTLVADRGAAAVKLPESVNLPQYVRFEPTDPGYRQGYLDALKLAIGTDDAGKYDKYTVAQDNCYWNDYHQRDYNLKIKVPARGEVPDKVLYVLANTDSRARTMTFGQMVALYGDYRRTTHCNDAGQCFLTDGDTSTVSFDPAAIYTGRAVEPYKYCPGAQPTPDYLRAIAHGLVPPFGSLGNTSSNSAGDAEYGRAGWWGDEMLRIANVNDWHFSSAAIAWYVGLHRLALIYAQKAASDPKFWNQALHYEANALHSLTDLFAFGHVVTNRDETTHAIIRNSGLLASTSYRWMENVLRMGGGTRDAGGRVSLGNQLPAIADLPTVRSDFQKSYRGGEVARANAEREYHDELNKSGATVRNLNGDVFVIYGDGRLHDLNPDAKAHISGAVQASLKSLFDAYVSMTDRKVPIEDVGKAGSAYFAALNYVPVYIESDPNTYFTGRWTRYARAVRDIAGSTQSLEKFDDCQVPYLSGADWTWPAKQKALCATGPQPARSAARADDERRGNPP